MTRDQKIVATGAASGVAAMAVLLWLLSTWLPTPPGADALDRRIAYALRWQALAALPLFLMVVAVGNARFASDAIDPTAGAEDRAMIINGRVADNTLQQFALFVAGSLALAASIPPDYLQVIGAAAIVFVIMRLLFWIGYRIDPLYRAFGFSSTAYMNLGLLAAALWLAAV
ncbi:MAPEG family protein [Sphingomonas parva]|uniref:MAPEG family protein n=1 Tax=Sphingomonas parva TaxID=2555898 RepID=A0A4Y8ZMN5_9SPHN|nr:MAPEG family protein [Sphingomonas parva]TFI57214.1 MAPEG family protein [Sphingomonas parva]